MDATAIGVLAGLGALFFVVGVAGGRAAVAWVPALPGMTRRQAVGIGVLGVALLLAAVVVAVAGALGTSGGPTASGPAAPTAPASAPTVSATDTGAGAGAAAGAGTRSPTASAGGRSYPVHVWWTDDGGPTTLHAYDGPDSQHWIATYTYGEALDVTCQAPHGRHVHVGPGYHGPDADSTVWYLLTTGGWIPAAYTNVPAAERIPVCD